MSLAAKGFGAIRRAARGLADLLLPGVCGACGASADGAGGLCEACNVRLLRLVSLPYCPRCGATCGPHVRQPLVEGCFACPTPQGRFERVFRLGPYTTPLREAIRGLKFHGRPDPVRRLAELLGDAIAAEPRDFPFDVIVPIPMHWLRRAGRTVDHAALLAEALGNSLALPVEADLVRIRNTPQQALLSRAERIRNVRGAFRARNAKAVRNARVLLLDDAATTGATADEAARTLLHAGAAADTLAVLAKGEPPRSYAAHWDANRNTMGP